MAMGDIHKIHQNSTVIYRGISHWSLHFLAGPCPIKPRLRKTIQIPASNSTGWWFEPLWKILVNWDDYSQYMGKYKKCSKPPTSFGHLILGIHMNPPSNCCRFHQISPSGPCQPTTGLFEVCPMDPHGGFRPSPQNHPSWGLDIRLKPPTWDVDLLDGWETRSSSERL